MKPRALPISALLICLIILPHIGLQQRTKISFYGTISYSAENVALEMRGAVARAEFFTPSKPEYLPWATEICLDLGINVIRVSPEDPWPTGFTVEEIREFLTEIDKVGMKAIIVLHPIKYLAPQWPETARPVEEAKTAIYDLIVNGGFVGDDRILMWDVYNEPKLDYPGMLDWIREMCAYVNDIDPTHPITIGGWSYGGLYSRPQHLDFIVDSVDWVQPHRYPWELPGEEQLKTRYINYFNGILSHSKGKPVFLGEWGCPVALGFCETEEDQAYIYNQILEAMVSIQDIKGGCFYLLYPPYGSVWSHQEWSPVRIDKTYRPAANWIKQYYK